MTFLTSTSSTSRTSVETIPMTYALTGLLFTLYHFSSRKERDEVEN